MKGSGMGFFGFPSRKDMTEMFGYVTPEDRDGWERRREAEEKKSPGTAREMADKSVSPALDMAKRGVQAQLHGAQYDAQRGSQPKQRQRVVTRETVTEQSRNIDSSGNGFEPDF